MSRFKKGMIDTLALVVIAASILGAFFIFMQINNLVGILKIKGEVSVYIDIQDRGTQILSFLRSEKNGMNYMTILGSYLADDVPGHLERNISETLEKFGTYDLSVWDENRQLLKEFTSLKPPMGGTFFQGKITLNWPVKNYRSISSGYGWREISGKKDFHGGIDFAVPEGTEVYSAYSKGMVVAVGKNCKPSPDVCKNIDSCKSSSDPFCCCNGGLGNYVVIEHFSGGEKFYTHYDHLSEVYVNVGYELGKDIQPNHPIGKSGRTGFVKGKTGEHLHFELSRSKFKSDDKSVDPCPYFPQPVPANCEQESHRSSALSVTIPMPNGKTGSVEMIT